MHDKVMIFAIVLFILVYTTDYFTKLLRTRIHR